MAWDLASCGIGSKAAFDGPRREATAQTKRRSFGTGRLAGPASATRSTGDRFNLIETWMLCAVCMQKWDALTAVAWHCVGSMFTAPLDYTNLKGDRASQLPTPWQTQVPKVDWCFDPRQAGPTGAASISPSLAGPTRGGQGPSLSAAGPLTTDEWTAWANRAQRQPDQ
eukprot:3485767-Amphidinium_carterae.1